MEARTLMLASNNVLFPSNGEPSIVPSQDIVLGLYYTTREKINALGEGMIFSNVDEVERAYLNNTLELGTKIVVRIKETSLNEGGENNVEHLRRYETTTGRAMLSKILPGLSFEELNKVLKKKEISKLINSSYRKCGFYVTVIFADKLLQSGFLLATKAGLSISVDDMLIPGQKALDLEHAEEEVKEIEQQFASGLVTQGERYNKVVDIWGRAGDKLKGNDGSVWRRSYSG